MTVKNSVFLFDTKNRFSIIMDSKQQKTLDILSGFLLVFLCKGGGRIIYFKH